MHFGLLDVFWIVFWIFVILIALQPVLQRRGIEFLRYQAIHEFEKQRGSRVILLIHRQDRLAYWGCPYPALLALKTQNKSCGPFA